MSDILVSDAGSARILTLNRPAVRNAMSRPLRKELGDALADAERDPSVRSVILTGVGRAFCAGLDLAELEAVLSDPPERQRADAHALAELFAAIHGCSKPVIAAVNGAAIGGGAGLATVCDVVVAERSARFGYSEVRLGFVPALVAVFVVRQLGERRARRLLLGGHLIGAVEAQTLGLVDEVVEDGNSLERAQVWAERFAGNAPEALTRTKALISELAGDLEPQMAVAAAANAEVRGGSELREGLRAFFERRPPAWAPPDSEA
jgi:methylglutaconyl-CoA hydratase